MKTDELISSAGETVEYASQYIQQQIDYLRLETAGKIAKTISNLITVGVVAVLILMVVLFLSVAFAFFLGTLLDSYALAFLCVAGFYALAAISFIYFKRMMITNPVLNMIIKNMLDD